MEATMESVDDDPSLQPEHTSEATDLQQIKGEQLLTFRPKADNKSKQLPARKVFKSRRRQREAYSSGREKIINSAPFRVFIRKILQDIKPGLGLDFEESALDALQEITENFLVGEFQLANLSAIYAKRATLQAKDMKEAAARRAKGALPGGPTTQEKVMQEAQYTEEDDHFSGGHESEGSESEDSESEGAEM